jgi:hypothetical protein
MEGRVEPAADIGGRDGSPVHADTDEATRELVQDHEHSGAPEHDGFAPQEVHAPEAVCRVSPMNDHQGPVPSGAGRSCFDSTRYTTFLSTSIPNVCEMIRASRGQPNRGLRDFSSTMAWMRASSGPFGQGFLGHRVDENNRQYLHCTKA